MSLDLHFEKTFPQGIEAVWHALTDREALGRWLMRTDFEPTLGRPFQLWFVNDAGEEGRFDCALLELDPPRRMVWSWFNETRAEEGPMTVTFSLEAVPDGTQLRIHHQGERDAATVEAFRNGWPGKIAALADYLG